MSNHHPLSAYRNPIIKSVVLPALPDKSIFFRNVCRKGDIYHHLASDCTLERPIQSMNRTSNQYATRNDTYKKCLSELLKIRKEGC